MARHAPLAQARLFGYLLSGRIKCTGCGKAYQGKRVQRGRVPAYYVCGGYVASGVEFCDSPRIPVDYLDDAVAEGIQKRLDIILDPAEMRRRVTEMLAATKARVVSPESSSGHPPAHHPTGDRPGWRERGSPQRTRRPG